MTSALVANGVNHSFIFPSLCQTLASVFLKIIIAKGSVYFAVNDIPVIAFRSILPQLHNPMSHEYYIHLTLLYCLHKLDC